MSTFAEFAAACDQRIELGVPPRRANALNLEVGQPMTRCRMRTPEHWGDADPGARRWIGSGGSLLVFGHCEPGACPLRAQVPTAD